MLTQDLRRQLFLKNRYFYFFPRKIIPLLDRHVRWRKEADLLGLSKAAKLRLEWFIFYRTKAGKDVSLTCRHFLVSRKTFYKWLSRNERFNRTLQDEFISLGNFNPDPVQFNKGLTEFLVEFVFVRPHQALGYDTPWQFYQKTAKVLPMYPSRTASCQFFRIVLINYYYCRNRF